MSVSVIVHVFSIGSQRKHYGMSQYITIYNFIFVNKTSLLKPVRYKRRSLCGCRWYHFHLNNFRVVVWCLYYMVAIQKELPSPPKKNDFQNFRRTSPTKNKDDNRRQKSENVASRSQTWGMLQIRRWFKHWICMLNSLRNPRHHWCPSVLATENAYSRF